MKRTAKNKFQIFAKKFSNDEPDEKETNALLASKINDQIKQALLKKVTDYDN